MSSIGRRQNASMSVRCSVRVKMFVEGKKKAMHNAHFLIRNKRKMTESKSKSKTTATHPKFSVMIREALTHLNDRNGSSKAAILKYILTNYKVNYATVNQHLKMSLRAGTKNQTLKQTKGIGASGSFKLATKTTTNEKKKKKPVATTVKGETKKKSKTILAGRVTKAKTSNKKKTTDKPKAKPKAKAKETTQTKTKVVPVEKPKAKAKATPKPKAKPAAKPAAKTVAKPKPKVAAKAKPKAKATAAKPKAKKVVAPKKK